MIIPYTGGVCKPPTVVAAADIPRGSKVVIYARVSSYSQRHRRRLESQLAALRRAADEGGLVVVGTYSGVERGKPYRRPTLKAAAKAARAHGATILAHDVNRVCRADDFHHRDNQATTPGPDEFTLLRRWIGPAHIATLVPPDATGPEIKGAEVKRGLEAARERGVRNGRRCRGDRDPDWLGKVLCLRQHGMGEEYYEPDHLYGPGYIAARLGVKKKVVVNALAEGPYQCGPTWGEMECPYDEYLELGLDDLPAPAAPGKIDKGGVCLHCGGRCLPGKRRRRDYCSDRCRMAASRARRG